MKFMNMKNMMKHDAPVKFMLPSGKYCPDAMMATEISQVSKYRINFDGTKDKKQYITIRFCQQDDFTDYLTCEKLRKIFQEYDGDEDLEVLFEIEEQTLGLYSIEEAIYFHQFEKSYKIDSIVFSLQRTQAQFKSKKGDFNGK